MKNILPAISTYIRHGLTAVIALGLTALVSHKILPAETANSAAASEATVNVVNGITFFVSAAVGRGLLYVASLFPFLAFLGETSTSDTAKATDTTFPTITALLHLATMTAVGGFCALAMLSCTVTTAPDGTTTKQVDQAAVEQGAGIFERLVEIFYPAKAPVIVVEPQK